MPIADPGPTIKRPPHPMEDIMAWKKPRVTEVSLALEINSYACAEIG
ncbi:pyrroloquinoline quinone precursor peptide PqqA [Belnapia sp. T18]|nr:pyrroloquinoline quinone precursor peptide PqqA [Belnapia arida]MBL6076749.1 pyrroloquinoline quinone precursor peptide PqqA [Belnapia arida]